MWRIELALILLLSLMVSMQSSGATQGITKVATDRPGDEPYTPTKLEWAAVELQASYGITTYSSENPLMIDFDAMPDGKTVRCFIQYPPDTSAKVVKINRDATRNAFDKYARARRWNWLRIEFDEHVVSN